MHREGWRERVDGQFCSDQDSLLKADVVWKSPVAAAQGHQDHTVMVCVQEPAWVQPTGNCGSHEDTLPER